MKKINIFLGGLLLSCFPTLGQTLNIDLGNVIYSYPANETGLMEYSDGKELTVMGNTYQINEITRIFVTEEDFENNLVSVNYSGNTASVNISYDIIPYISSETTGAFVSIKQSKEVGDETTGEITYRLSGSSENGSFALDGSFKCSIELTGLNLVNPSGAAIDIDNGKRIAVRVAEGTVNYLEDGTDGDQKACLYAKGHLEFKQKGTLNIIGRTGHAIAAKEYVEIKNTKLNITGAVKDGINCTQYFLMESGSLSINGVGDDGIQCDYKDSENRDDEDTGTISIEGGSLNITVSNDASKALKAEGDFIISEGSLTALTTGNGIWDDSKLKTKASSCIGADGNIVIEGGEINLTSTGSGGKGISADLDFKATGGNISILTEGGVTAYVNGSLSQNYTGNVERLNADYKSSAKAIKIDGNIDIDGGTFDITTKGNNAEGIETKSVLTISGGNIKVRAYEDGTNSSSTTFINDGILDIISTGNGDAIDSNGDIYINGGNIRVFASINPENGLDAGDGYKTYINGGELLAYGPGGNAVPASSQEGQAYLSLNETVKGGDKITVSTGDEILVSFDVPEEYAGTNAGGNGGGFPGGGRAPGFPGGGGFGNMGGKLLLSCPELIKGNSYTVTIGESSVSSTAN